MLKLCMPKYAWRFTSYDVCILKIDFVRFASYKLYKIIAI